MFLDTLDPVERTLQEGMRKKEFYAFVISKMDRRIDTNLPSAGAVSLDKGSLEWVLLINPKFLNTRAKEIWSKRNSSDSRWNSSAYNKLDEDGVPVELKKELLYSIMVHEFLHLTLNHIKRFRSYADEITPQGLNIAGDLAINSMLNTGPYARGLHDYGAIFPDHYDFPEGLTMDQYIHKLKKNAGQNELGPTIFYQAGGGEGPGQIGPGDKGGQNGLGGDLEFASESAGDMTDPGNVANQDTATEKLKSRVRQTIRKLQKQNVHFTGLGSGDSEFLLDWVARKQTINWQEMLRNSLQGVPSFESEPTYSRSSRRDIKGLILKGRRRLRKERVMVLVDTSGSMGTDDYEKVFGVLDSLEKTGTQVKVALWDYGHLYKEPQDLSRFKDKKAVLDGGGGTNMKAGIDYLCENYGKDFEKILCVTDGWTPYHDKSEPPKKDLVWLVTTDASMDNCAGTLIRLK